MYEILKFVHIVGVVLLLGNVTASAVWRVFADRSGDLTIIAFAQRLITLTDWSLTLGGIVLTIIGGYGMLWVGQISPFDDDWLVFSQALFVVSGAMWALILVPLQIRLGREAKRLTETGVLPQEFRIDSRAWIFWGIVATIPLVGALYLMVTKAG